MTPPHNFGDTPVPDTVTTNKILLAIDSRLDKQDQDLAEIKRFFKGDSAKGEDGALSRLNSHSKDIESHGAKIDKAYGAAFAALWMAVVGLLSFFGVTVWNKIESKATAHTQPAREVSP